MPKTREERLAYNRAYYAANREKLLEQQRLYRATHRDQLHGQWRTYREANREEQRIKARAYYAAHREKQRIKARAYQATHKAEKRAYRAANRSNKISTDRRYRASHQDNFSTYKKVRRARKANAPLNNLTHLQWVEIQAVQKHRCYYCGKRCKGRLTQDHITPLSKGGSHTLHNVIGACGSCNSKKHVGAPLKPVQPLLLTIAAFRSA